MKHIFNRSKSLFVSVTAAIAAAAMLCACTAGAGTSAGGAGSTAAPVRDSFTFGIATEVYNLDPFASTTADARAVYFNIYEGLTEEAFPDSYYFEGNRGAAFTQIGNAVPPLMSSEIAKRIKAIINNKCILL